LRQAHSAIFLRVGQVGAVVKRVAITRNATAVWQPSLAVIQLRIGNAYARPFCAYGKFEKLSSGPLYVNAKGGPGGDAPLAILLYHAGLGIQPFQRVA
jgi:hypothetical protein